MFLSKPVRVNTGIDIVIAVHDALTELQDMLASVDALTELPHHKYLVNDRSGMATVNWLQQYEQFHTDTVNVYHLVKPEIGYTCAINLGIARGHNRYVVVMNTDVIVTRYWLSNMIACMQRAPTNGIVGPLSNAATYQSIPNIKDENSSNWSKNQLPHGWTPDGVSRAVAHLSDRTHPNVPFLNGFCMLIKRKVFDTIGLFDAKHFPLGYGEENDLVLRAKKAGYQAVVDDATYVYHHKTRSFTEIQRKQQSIEGRQQLLMLHSDFSAVESQLIDKMNTAVKNTRERIKHALNYPELFHGPSLRILFMLPSTRPGGGSTSVIREAQEMERLGVTTRIALWTEHIPNFTSVYPDARYLFVPWPREIRSNEDNDTMHSLRWYGTCFDIVIATMWMSVDELFKMAQLAKTFLPAYYVQDYEPDFYMKNDTERVLAANKSYDLITQLGGIMYTKSTWLANRVTDTHGTPVHIVPAAIEDLECQCAHETNSSIVRIVAMLRPRTPRRNAEYTYKMLQLLKHTFGTQLDIVTFGCNLQEAPFVTDKAFQRSHIGHLNRSAISNLYATTHVFLDLSLWQAYGRSAAEAMTCGNIAIVTRVGGANEFIRHGYNGFLVDIQNQNELLSIVKHIVDHPELLAIMQQRARHVREQLRLQPAVLARLQLFVHYLKLKNENRTYEPWQQLLIV